MKNLNSLKGIHEGQRGFIVGNGPSVRNMNLDKLVGEISFGLNACARFYEWTIWRPTYWLADTTVTMDLHHLPHARAANVEAAESFLFQDAPAEFEGFRLNFIHAEIISLRDPNGLPRAEWWSDDPTSHVSRYGTISFAALQIAVWLGLNPIYVIGMDLGFKDHEIAGQDPNHADADYNPPQPGMNWKGLIYSQQNAHKLARENAKRLGAEIYNASDGGDLKAYERVDYLSLFNGRSPK
jgi:hypothetical protein